MLDAGYDDFLRNEGEVVEFPEATPPPAENAPLPDEKTVKALMDRVREAYRASETERAGHIKLVNSYWDDYELKPYDAETMPLPEQQSFRHPLTRSRVDDAHGALYEALALSPFYQADVGDGQDGTIGVHATQAIGEELERAEFENALDVALKGSLVGTIGVLKFTVNADSSGEARLDVEGVDIRDLYLAPHNVRDLQQCTMVAQAYVETLRWVRDMALDGVFNAGKVAELSGGTADEEDDANSTERAYHDLTDSESTGEARRVRLLEAYIRVRLQEGVPSELWRVICEPVSWVCLRAERWADDLPFVPLRHGRGNTTLYAPAFPAVLRDLQWGADMLFSSAFEADRMSVAPFVEYDVLSPAAEMLRKRQESGGKAVRVKPGELIPSRGGQPGLRFTYHQPASLNLEARLNRIEASANNATIPSYPAQTYRSATEHRYAYAAVSRKENQMLKVLRADLTRASEVVKRLYWKYIATPMTDAGDVRVIRHGTIGYLVTEQQWAALRFTPRGMTSKADQMMQLQAAQQSMQVAMQLLPQKPMMLQAQIWPNMWEAARALMEALGVREYHKIIGPDPVVDPSEIQLDPRAQQASMMLMAANNPQGGAGMAGLLPPGADQGARSSDGAPTVMPGGNPTGGVN